MAAPSKISPDRAKRILLHFNTVFKAKFGADFMPFLLQLRYDDLRPWVRVGLFIAQHCNDYTPGIRISVLRLVEKVFLHLINASGREEVIRRAIGLLTMKNSRLWTISLCGRRSLSVSECELAERAEKFEKFETLLGQAEQFQLLFNPASPNGDVGISVNGKCVAAATSIILGRVLYTSEDDVRWSWDSQIPNVTIVDYAGISRWLPKQMRNQKEVSLTKEDYSRFLLTLGVLFNLDYITFEDSGEVCIGIADAEEIST